MPTSSVARAVAVTGAAGFIGTRLVPALAAAGVPRIVGLDMRDPVRTVAGYEHHLVDVAGRKLDTVLQGCDTVVHLAAVTDPIVDDGLMARVNIDGTRHVLDAAGRVGVRRIVRVSPAAVYGAWATNPVPLTEDAPLRPNPGFAPAVHAAEVERLLHEWAAEHPDAMVTVLRAAPVLGAGAEHLFARLLAGWRRPRVRGEGAPVQVVHVDDLVDAVLRTVTANHPGVFDVAAAGWLGADEVRALLAHGALPAAPLDVVRRVLSRSWQAGIGDVPPAVLPYLVQPWVIATDRLEALGWAPAHTNEETLLETHDALSGEAIPTARLVAAAAGALVVGAVGGYAIRRAARSLGRVSV
jgi:UDP-glucose 4-epimerase